MRTKDQTALAAGIAALCLAVLAASGQPAAAAKQRVQVMYAFQGGDDGAQPSGLLAEDKNGNLYGVTEYGGTGTCSNTFTGPGCGTIYQLTPPKKHNRSWTHTVLYSFQNDGSDGINPVGGVTFGPDGALYGATQGGGSNIECGGCGTIWRLQPPVTEGGDWTESIIWSFELSDGEVPSEHNRLAFAADGSLFATTTAGGANNGGTLVQ